MINKIFNFQFSIFKSSRGFTILEAIISILILSLSISGVFSAVRQGLSQATIAKDQVTAFYLAQEATEIIRNKRDANQLAKINGGSGAWLDGITNAANCPINKVCQTDAVSNSLVLCGDNWNSCPVLNQDTSTFLYNYTTGSPTPFKREIQIESISGNPDEISITVRVTWRKGALNESFEAKTFLFNWI